MNSKIVLQLFSLGLEKMGSWLNSLPLDSLRTSYLDDQEIFLVHLQLSYLSGEGENWSQNRTGCRILTGDSSYEKQVS